MNTTNTSFLNIHSNGQRNFGEKFDSASTEHPNYKLLSNPLIVNDASKQKSVNYSYLIQ